MTDIHRAFVSVRWRADVRDELAELLAPAVVVQSLDQADVAIIGGNADARVLRAPALRWLHCDHAGIDGYAPTELVDGRFVVTTSAGRSAGALAEHALFLMLALSHDAPRLLRAQRRRAWGFAGIDERRALVGRHVCIVGTGHIGTELARRCRAFGMTVTGYRRRDEPADAAFEQVRARDRGERLVDGLPSVDVLVLAASLNDESHHLVGEQELRALPARALFVNMGRGGLVDERALIAVLRAGHLGGAGLDVVSVEPLAVSSPLWRMNNVVITPHATPRGPDRDRASFEIVADNIRRFRAGEPLRNVVAARDAYTCGPDASRGERLITGSWNLLNHKLWGR